MEIQTHRNPHLSAPRSGSLPAELVHLSLIKTYKTLRAGKWPLFSIRSLVFVPEI